MDRGAALQLFLVPAAMWVALPLAHGQLMPHQDLAHGEVTVVVRTLDGRRLPSELRVEVTPAGSTPLVAPGGAGRETFSFPAVAAGLLTIRVEAPGYFIVTQVVNHQGRSRIDVVLLPKLVGLRGPDPVGDPLLAPREWVIPTNVEPAIQRLLADAARRTPSAAIASLQRARAASPDLYATHNNLGVSYLRQGLSKAALASLGRAVELEPESAIARRNLGLALLAAGRAGDAVGNLKTAAELAPKSQRTMLGLAEAYFQQQRWSEAAEVFDLSLELGEPPNWIFLRLGQAHLQQGQLQAAVPWLRRYAATTEPGSEVVGQWLQQRDSESGRRP